MAPYRRMLSASLSAGWDSQTVLALLVTLAYTVLFTILGIKKLPLAFAVAASASSVQAGSSAASKPPFYCVLRLFEGLATAALMA